MLFPSSDTFDRRLSLRINILAVTEGHLRARAKRRFLLRVRKWQAHVMYEARCACVVGGTTCCCFLTELLVRAASSLK